MAKILNIFKFIIICNLLIITSSLNAQPITTAIYLGKNQTSKIWAGKLSPKQNSVLYAFKASKNQYATLELMPRRGYSEFANVGVITSPNGKSEGGKGGIVYQACLPQSGNYTIRIGRNLMATEGDTAGFIAKLTILPVSQSKQKCV